MNGLWLAWIHAGLIAFTIVNDSFVLAWFNISDLPKPSLLKKAVFAGFAFQEVSATWGMVSGVLAPSTTDSTRRVANRRKLDPVEKPIVVVTFGDLAWSIAIVRFAT